MTVTDADASYVLDAAELSALPELQKLEALLAKKKLVSAGGLWGSSQALAIAWLAARPTVGGRRLLVACSTDPEAEGVRADLAAFGLPSVGLPAREGSASGEAAFARLSLAQAMTGPPNERPRVVVASVQALLEPLPPMADLEKEFVTLRKGDVMDPSHLLRHLIELGYVRQPLAESPGEVSLRGDILDIYPFAANAPLRVELFEDEIESLRNFDPADQRSTDRYDELRLCLAADTAEVGDAHAVLPAELFEDDTLFVDIEPLRVEEQAEALRIRSAAHERALRKLNDLRAKRRRLTLASLPGDDLVVDTRSVQSLEGGMKQAAESLAASASDTPRLIVVCTSEADEMSFTKAIERQGGVEGLETRRGVLSRGFRIPGWGLLLVNHHELKGVLGSRRRARPRVAHKVRAIQSFFELKPHDLVVHAVHGLSRYRGLQRMKRGAGEEEHLHLEFADEVSLYVPASRIDLVQRYVGSGATTLALDKIGSSAFKRRKEKVQRGLFDLAAELIEVQAKRTTRERPAWDGDAELVREMVECFPYEPTEDQAKTDLEIAKDLGSPRPMDRLICGDVGFGKTELAIRAAFRVVAGGGQVAVLVPTTILAQQHHETFSERLADFPVSVEVVSRYVAPKKVRDVIERTAAGEVDILIGTHRILSKDVRFHRLGLTIVDEEQRFGVTHKEHFKMLRSTVDLLTLTATPIPRTLHMSLSGLRDISALSVAPPGRQIIETVLGYKDDEVLIRDAILREKSRGGQVFFLHNRVGSIEEVQKRLAAIVPGVTFAIGHGQMGAPELRKVMRSFTRGEADVLVATTIIENGVDIPSAGTILIDDADRFGLSELHQLRGRVGRGSQKAWCYLLVERHKPLRQIARERLKALEEMNHLGAGFGISIKDLELRGAGNVLGAEQSGHIAAVGYDMYCRLLKLTVDRLLSGEDAAAEVEVAPTEDGVELELGLRAFLPKEWIPDADARIEVLRELSNIDSRDAGAQAAHALRDRFGRPPHEALALVRLFTLQALLEPFHIRSIALRDEVYVVSYGDAVGFERLFGKCGAEVRRIRSGLAHVILPVGKRDPESAVDWLEALLRRA